jgi:hypothetical protein
VGGSSWISSPLSASREWAQPKATGWLRPAWPKGAPKTTGTSSADRRDGLFAVVGLLGGGEEIADDEAARSVQGAAEEELGDEAVEAVGGFVQVLEEHDAVAEGGLERRAAHGGEGGDVAAGERAFGAAFLGSARLPGELVRRPAEEEVLQALLGFRVLAELRAHGAVDRGHARPPPEIVQQRGVAVAHEQLPRHAVDVGGEAEQAVAAAGEDDGLGIAVQGGLQLGLAPLVAAGEVAGARKDFVAVAGDELHVPQGADAALEALAVEGAGGRDHVDGVAWEEGLHEHSVTLTHPAVAAYKRRPSPARPVPR